MPTPSVIPYLESRDFSRRLQLLLLEGYEKFLGFVQYRHLHDWESINSSFQKTRLSHLKGQIEELQRVLNMADAPV